MTAKTPAMIDRCPTCGSTDPNTAASNCYNGAWHRGDAVHLQREPIGTPRSQCSAACGAEIDDPPSQLAVDREFITCQQCRREIYARIADEATAAIGGPPGLGDLVRQGKLDSGLSIIQRHQELSDDEIDRATLDDLRTAYRTLRDHHVAETTALASRRDDLTRRRDDRLARSQEILAESQRLLVNADAIMRRDEETIDRLSTENARLAEIIDFMQNRYSPLGGRACALCVYEDGRFIRSCAMHRWDDRLHNLDAPGGGDPP